MSAEGVKPNITFGGLLRLVTPHSIYCCLFPVKTRPRSHSLLDTHTKTHTPDSNEAKDVFQNYREYVLTNLQTKHYSITRCFESSSFSRKNCSVHERTIYAPFPLTITHGDRCDVVNIGAKSQIWLVWVHAETENEEEILGDASHDLPAV